MILNTVSIDSLLQPFHRFGVHLGLERIHCLLANLGNPHQSIPIVHIAGSNGKGSVCAYLSSVLIEAGYTVGRYTSPHLVDWTERICLNNHSIPETTLANLLQQIQAAIDPTQESPTQFEVITAAAWLYFVQSGVDIAVIEVGLGGRLDATNVCEKPLVSVITSISREHWQQLGPTVADIAGEKAGILKRECPAVIGQLPLEAQAVVKSHLEALNCPAVWVEPARRIRGNWAEYHHNSTSVQYSLPLLGDIQLMNSAIAIATLQILQQQGWQIPLSVMQAGMQKTQWLGRLQWTQWHDYPILIDGAHNQAAAQALRQYVDTLNKPITWVMGMLSTKDHSAILKVLLTAGDRAYFVPVPDHSTAQPEALANLAIQVCPPVKSVRAFPDVFLALNEAISSRTEKQLVVLCGSLYLVGYFLRRAN